MMSVLVIGVIVIRVIRVIVIGVLGFLGANAKGRDTAGASETR
jgi:hypothetical protein